ncbi:Tubulin polyglutamylase ttll6 [Hondaea fermentalgiana]|uniref:Tubulin polyglutamylase ttll6 n=1 Tax=Hondaea fermentalgiana TaxID=2315210 RepID=A0A2R5GUR1_9STRA|nr:Tubulin polyglutamylase ttll6 [Hondaea fermentalgiana]|eukprot:GBG34592.1 Tubulin polyglutamylase ttll6 [Hondaea fermentalgiana]
MADAGGNGRYQIPRRPKRTRSNDLGTNAAAQALAQAAAQAAAWHDESRENLMETVVFHVIALRAIVLGFSAAILLLGISALVDASGARVWLGMADQGSCELPEGGFAAPTFDASISAWDTRLSCRDAQAWDHIHLVGRELHVTSADSLGACCSACSARRRCVGLSFNFVADRCVLFKDHISDAVQASWTRSLVIHTQAGVNASSLSKHCRPARETERWDPAWTYERALAPPSFSVESTYRDPSSRNRRTRTDYRDHVTGALRDVGLVPISSYEPSVRADVVWALHWETEQAFAEAALGPWQLLNMVPGALDRTLGEKDALHRTTRAARARLGATRIDAFMPHSLVLPDEAAALSAEPDRVWIWKPLRSWSGDGIAVLTGSQAQARATRERLGTQKVILQSYILRPLTLMGHKFDARWWAIVTSVAPLRIYSIPDAYLRPAALPYRTDRAGLVDKCIHVTNGKVFKHCKGSRKLGLASHHVRDRFLLDTLRDEAGGLLTEDMRGKIRRTLVSRTQTSLVKTILLALPGLLEARNWTQARTFQLLSFDVIYDAATASPWIEEVNTNGFLGSGVLEVSRAMSSDILRDMFVLVGAAGYDRSTYQASLERAILRRGSDARASVPAVQAAVDELFAPQRSWKMIYPRIRDPLHAEIDAFAQDAGDDAEHGKLLADLLPGIPGQPALSTKLDAELPL